MTDVATLKTRFQEIEAAMSEPDFWERDDAGTVAKQHAEVAVALRRAGVETMRPPNERGFRLRKMGDPIPDTHPPHDHE